MKTHQILAAILACVLFSAAVVTFLVMNGVHLLLAITGVYLFAVFSMLCMQRRARESFEVGEKLICRPSDRSQATVHFYAKDFSG